MPNSLRSSDILRFPWNICSGFLLPLSMLWVAISLLLVLTLTGACSAADGTPSRGFSVLSAQIEGAITPATEGFVTGALAAAKRDGHQAVLFTLDTPGGLVSSMRVIVSAILGADIPVIVWVGPSGARATSAGVFLVAAADVAAMSPQTTIGAASPVEMGGKDMDKTMESKVKNDLMSYIRGLAEKRGRNAAWYQDSVDSAVSITANEAAILHVVDMIAASPADIMAQLEPKGLPAGKNVIRFRLADVSYAHYEPSIRYRLLSWLLDPQIAYILLLAGIAGLFFEFTTPGAVLPGVVGGLSLLLALYAFSILPTNVAGFLLILFAVVLFILEIFIVSFGMLAMAGLAALFIGSLILIEPTPGLEGIPLTTVIATVGAVAAILLFCLVLITKAQRGRKVHGVQALIGMSARITKWDGSSGLVQVRGELWSATTPEVHEFQPGDVVRIVSAKGLVLGIAIDQETSAE